ncbi:hypothetical protein HS041_20160 [Planomonospora sp. ID67723]|uniref:hypothetical protein n=1 Tax=Planomonospora sp. ID67723 TaxID=2738134 RepID=UPI0018C3D103|nr:hypothetical protein [Planomonospora sp. ID67723]MBG0830085.1 hypothetical protein [Planomonospora sp. ID67723]
MAATQVSVISAARAQGLTSVADIRHADTQISGFSPVREPTVPSGTDRQAVRFGRETMIAGTLLGRAPRTLSTHHAKAWATSLLRTRLLPWTEIEEDCWHTTSDLLIQQYALFSDRGWILLGGVVRAPRPSAGTNAYMLAWAEEALGLADSPAWLPGPEHDGTWYAALPDTKP